ncbi:MAG: TolC family protein [Puniceicoccales bacterium]|nr:TolC family protein [Puniceicoccales bacterium]
MVVIEKFFCKLCNLFLVGISVGLLVGCSIDNGGVAKKGNVFWNPPIEESQAKQRQLQKYSNTNLIPDLSASALDLPMLLDIAFENNPSTKKSWQAARIAAAQSGKAASIFFPRITISGVAEKLETSTRESKNSAMAFYPAIEIQYSIFQFGGHAKYADAARQLLYAANYQYNRALQTLAYEVQKCYFALDSAEETVKASQKNLDDAFVAYDAAFIKNQAGLSNIQDFLQAKANRSRAEFDLENANAHVELARANLATAIGVPVSEAVRIVQSSDENDIKDLDINVQDLIAGAMQTRQDMLAQYSIITAKKDMTWTNSSKLLPELVIGGAGNRKWFRGGNDYFNNFNVYASLRWTIFDGFSNMYDVIESRAALRSAEQELKRMQLSIASDVWAKYYAFKSAIKQLNAARNYEQSAQESFDSIVIAYKGGLSSFGDLMAAQTQLATARKQTVVSKNSLSVAVVDLAYVIGIVNFENKNNIQQYR